MTQPFSVGCEDEMKHPLVVGHKGEIGSFLVGGLLKFMDKALDITCFDVCESEKEAEERIENADVIFLCVPIKETVSWLLKHKKILKEKIIFEQASLKEWIYREIREDRKGLFGTSLGQLDIRSMHVMFRRGTDSG